MAQFYVMYILFLSSISNRTWQWVTRNLSYKKKEMFPHLEHLGSTSVFSSGIGVTHRFRFLCVFIFFFLSSFCVLCLMSPVFPDCPFLVTSPVFTNVYFQVVYLILHIASKSDMYLSFASRLSFACITELNYIAIVMILCTHIILMLQ